MKLKKPNVTLFRSNPTRDLCIIIPIVIILVLIDPVVKGDDSFLGLDTLGTTQMMNVSFVLLLHIGHEEAIIGLGEHVM